MESPSLSKNTKANDNPLLISNNPNWNLSTPDNLLSSDYCSALPSQLLQSPPPNAAVNSAVKERAPSAASTDSPPSAFDSGVNPTASWVKSNYFDSSVSSVHPLHTPSSDHKSAAAVSSGHAASHPPNVGMPFSSHSSSTWPHSLNFDQCANVWSDFGAPDGNFSNPITNTGDLSQARRAHSGEWSSPSPHLPNHKANSTENVFQNRSRTNNEDSTAFFDANDFVNQHDVPPDSSLYSQPCGVLLSSRARSLSSEFERRDSQVFGESRKKAEKFRQDDGKSTVPTTEALIQSAIAAPPESQWGRTPIDQSTRWPPPVCTSLMPGSDVDRKNSVNDSNVWSNEPPDGTRIWEEFYTMQGLVRSLPPPNNNAMHRPNNLQMNVSKPSPSHSRSDRQFNSTSSYELQSPEVSVRAQSNAMPGMDHIPSGAAGGSVFPLSPSQILNRGQASWSSASPIQSSSAHHNIGDVTSGWPPSTSYQGQSSGYGNRVTPVSSDNRPFPSPVSSHASQSFPLPPGLLNVPGSVIPRLKNDMSMAMRANQVKYLCSLGFPRADVQQALIMNNMDMDRALGELCVRYGGRMPQSFLDNLSSALVGNRAPPPGTSDYAANLSALVDFSNMGALDAHQVQGSTPHAPYHPPLPPSSQVMPPSFRYGVNSRVNPPPNVPSTNPASNLSRQNSLHVSSATGSLDPQLTASKMWQNLLLLQARLRHVTSEISQLQSMANRGGGTQQHQIQKAFQTLYNQQQRLIQQITVCQNYLKTASNEPVGISNLSAHLNELSLNGPPPGGLGGNTPSLFSTPANAALSVGTAVGGMSFSNSLPPAAQSSQAQNDSSTNLFSSTWNQ